MEVGMQTKRIVAASALLTLALIAAAFGWLYATRGAYGVDAVVRRGGSYWITIRRDDERLSASMRLALQDAIPDVVSGAFAWSEPEPGFEVAEMPVLADGREVDRILLNRIDPKRFRFVVRNEIGRDIDEWERSLPDDVLIVNGSYFDLKGGPDTPVVSEANARGPQRYDAKAGAFADFDGQARLFDLKGEDWRQALSRARNGLVSYPLLLAADGNPRVGPESRWLSNRTFLAQDGSGRIIVGTTRDAFFSLARLGLFLKDTPLDVRLALNLDGGPIACQSVRLKGFSRKFYAAWESQFRDGQAILLRTVFSGAHWAMPMVVTVERRTTERP
jgi:hypothetical protein